MSKTIVLATVITLAALTSGCASTSQTTARLGDQPVPAATSTQSVPAETAEKKTVASTIGGAFGSLFAGISNVGSDIKRGFNDAFNK
ncbi:hypothetical protein D3C71_20080 [compost metagenome]